MEMYFLRLISFFSVHFVAFWLVLLLPIHYISIIVHDPWSKCEKCFPIKSAECTQRSLFYQFRFSNIHLLVAIFSFVCASVRLILLCVEYSAYCQIVNFHFHLKTQMLSLCYQLTDQLTDGSKFIVYSYVWVIILPTDWFLSGIYKIFVVVLLLFVYFFFFLLSFFSVKCRSPFLCNVVLFVRCWFGVSFYVRQFRWLSSFFGIK